MKHVYQKGNSLYYVKRRSGKLVWTRLCAANAPPEEQRAAYNRIEWRGRNLLADVLKDYEKARLPRLGLRTQAEYSRVIEKRLIPVFGHMRPDDVSQQDIAMYLERRDQDGHGPSGNREIAVLSSAFNHGMRIGLARINPTYGVRRNTEKPRTFYVSNGELRQALRNTGPGLRHLMWVAYLTGLRQRDLFNIRRQDIDHEGITVHQSKDGKHVKILWSDSLRKVVRRGLRRSRCTYVFTNDHGQKLSRYGVQSAMRRMKGKTGIVWRFHDLRAKAESDHTTGLGLMTRYNRAKRLKAVR